MHFNSKKKIVMLVRNDVSVDTRVKKEAASLADAGYEVIVLGLQKNNDLPQSETLQGFTILRPQLKIEFLHNKIKQMGASSNTAKTNDVLSQKIFNRKRLLNYFFNKVLKPLIKNLRFIYYIYLQTGYYKSIEKILVELKPDLIHAHDLNTQYAAYRYAKLSGIPFIYDSHELELHRNKNYFFLDAQIDAYFENKCIKKAKKVITVAPAIADFLEKYYSIPKPCVVLNSPPLSSAEIQNHRHIREVLNCPESSCILVYIGLNSPGRGLEQVAQALCHLPKHFHFAVVGPRHEINDSNLLALSQQLGVNDRIHLLDPVHSTAVPTFIRTADIAVIPFQNVCYSHELALPNKLFDAVFARLPISTSKRIVMQKFITQHKMGEVFDDTNPQEIADTLQRMSMNLQNYKLSDAAWSDLCQELCWEQQAKKLVNLYKEL